MNIVMFGDFSGRNVGHNALLTALVDQVAALEPSLVTIPTLRPRAIRRVLGERSGCMPLGVAPWHGSMKFHGPRVRRAVDRADLVLLVDNHLHDKGFGHPLKGNLRALLSLTARASRRGIPAVYFHGSVGPLSDDRARPLAAALARRLDLVLLRDADAERDLLELAPDVSATRTADAGFGLGGPRWGGDGRILVNLTDAGARRTLDGWVALLESLATELGRRVVVAVTHPGDRAAARAIVDALGPEVADLHDPSPEAFLEGMAQSLGDISCAIGDRYHELVMLAALGVPIVGVETGDKVLGLFESLGLPELVFDPAAEEEGGPVLATTVARAGASADALRDAVEGARAALGSGTRTLERLLGPG